MIREYALKGSDGKPYFFVMVNSFYAGFPNAKAGYPIGHISDIQLSKYFDDAYTRLSFDEAKQVADQINGEVYELIGRNMDIRNAQEKGKENEKN